MSDDILKKIETDKRAYVASCKAQKPLSVIEAEAKTAPALRPFFGALKARHEAGKISLITEIKKASPSAGIIRNDFNPPELARTYEKAGAACLSVLTDAPYFQGKDADLIAARNACTLPVLRKDFMLDPYQIVESRALGADCILIIMASLSDTQADELMATAATQGLSILVEVHDRAELDRALPLVAKHPNTMLGINNRNLKTLTIDLANSEELVKHVPAGTLLVGESGIKGRSDIERLKRAGLSCFLIGENLLKQQDVAAATRALLN